VSDTLGRRLIYASAVLTLLVVLIFGGMLYAIGDLIRARARGSPNRSSRPRAR